MDIKDRIKERRLELGLTLEQVAKAVGTSKQTIHRYESGIISNIPSDKIEAIATTLKVTPAYLMGWEDETEEDVQPYYLDPDVVELTNELLSRPELKVLFSATRDVSKEDIEAVASLLERMKKD